MRTDGSEGLAWQRLGNAGVGRWAARQHPNPAAAPKILTTGPWSAASSRHPGGSQGTALSSPQPHYLQAHLWICFHSPLLQAREGKRGAGLVLGTWEQNPRGLHGGNGGARGSSPLLIWQLPRGLSQAGWLRGATGCSEPSRDCASPVPKGLTAEDVMLINIVGASGEVLG